MSDQSASYFFQAKDTVARRAYSSGGKEERYVVRIFVTFKAFVSNWVVGVEQSKFPHCYCSVIAYFSQTFSKKGLVALGATAILGSGAAYAYLIDFKLENSSIYVAVRDIFGFGGAAKHVDQIPMKPKKVELTRKPTSETSQ